MKNIQAMRRWMMAILCLLLVGQGCSSGERVITGQIFIVLKSRETLKLSLVEVQIITESAAQSIQARVIQGRTNLAVLKPSLAKMETQLKALLSEQLKRTSEMDLLRLRLAQMDRLPLAKTYAELKQIEDTQREISDKLRVFQNESAGCDGEIKKLISERRVAQERADLFRSNAFYFGGETNPPCVAVMTDADGRFTINSKGAGRFYLVAQASRSIGEKTEDYGWILPASNATRQEFILSNNNLIAD